MPQPNSLVRSAADDVGVLTLTLDDPDNRNGWSEPMENVTSRCWRRRRRIRRSRS